MQRKNPGKHAAPSSTSAHLMKRIKPLEEKKSAKQQLATNHPKIKITIGGAGIAGFVEALLALFWSKKNNTPIRLTMYDKNDSMTDTTGMHVVPSKTIDEILSVVPRGPELVKKLEIPFNQPGGIRIEDVPGINDSESALEFIKQVQKYSEDEKGHAARTDALLQLGKKSMELWQYIYNSADEKLKNILIKANFNPCGELADKSKTVLHEGYRIDLIFKIPDAAKQATTMRDQYSHYGYTSCKLLSPSEVKELDSFLTTFCDNNSHKAANGEEVWNNDAVALYRPGGCIDTQILLPLLAEYIREEAGQYVNEKGIVKDNFHLKYQRNINELIFENNNDKLTVEGFKFSSGYEKHHKYPYEKSEIVLCPGEAVGTLTKLDIKEPAYAGFAGPSLMLEIPIPADQKDKLAQFSHCMEVHQEGVVLAWQARIRNNKIFIGVAGTKAFYGDVTPHIDEDFAKTNNLLQLNIVNQVLPDFISLALKKDTHDKVLLADDLNKLVEFGIATRWVGTRAVAYDGFPTVGRGYRASTSEEIMNMRITTHLGSGGGSFGPAAAEVSRQCREEKTDELTSKVLEYGSSLRRP